MKSSAKINDMVDQDKPRLQSHWSAVISQKSGRPMRDEELKALNFALLKNRPVRQKEFIDANIHQQSVADLVVFGLLKRVSRGCYLYPSESQNYWGFLAMIATRWPNAVICGPTAAAYHGFFSDDPEIAWIAVPRGRGHPVGIVEGRNLRVREWREERFKEGVQTVIIDSVHVKIVSPEHAIAELKELGRRVSPELLSKAVMAYAKSVGDIAKLESSMRDTIGYPGIFKANSP